jgi:hypothetical protein
MAANTAAEPTTTSGVGGATNLNAATANSANEGGPNLEVIATNVAGEPSATTPPRGATSINRVVEEMRTLTDDVICNWLLYGFELLKPIN